MDEQRPSVAPTGAARPVPGGHAVRPAPDRSAEIAAALLALTVIVAAFLAFYVRDRLSNIERQLPGQLLVEQSAAALLANDLAELHDRIIAVQAGRRDHASIREAAIAAQTRLASIRAGFNLDSALGIAGVHAAIAPALADVLRWLDPQSRPVRGEAELLTLIEARVAAARTQATGHLESGNERAIAILRSEGEDLSTLSESMLFMLGGVVLLAALSAGLIMLHRRDSTVRARMAAAAARSEVGLRAALESFPDGFTLWDREDRLIAYNQRIVDLMFMPGAFDAFDPIGHTFEELVRRFEVLGIGRQRTGPFDKSIRERVEAHQRGGASSIFQLADGRWIQAVDGLTRDGMVVSIYSDITESKTREDLLLQAKLTAELASRAKSDFLSIVSHELRTPLNAIIGFAELIVQEIQGPLGHKCYRDYAEDILSGGRQLLSTVNDILDLSKLEAGKTELLIEPVDLREVIVSSCRQLTPQAERLNVIFEIDAGEEPLSMRADERALRRILSNLLTNAVKFSKRGGHVWVRGKVNELGDAEIEVADEGIGMRPEDLPNAFAPFGQLDNAWNRKNYGTGLGLPIVKGLTELHGGRIEVETALGKGARFRLFFPRLEGDRAVAHTVTVDSPSLTNRAPGP